MNRDSFVLYADSLDILDLLSDEQAGQLFRAIRSYVKGDDLPEIDQVTKIAFVPIKNQDLESVRLRRLLGDPDCDLTLAGHPFLYFRCFRDDIIGKACGDCAVEIADKTQGMTDLGLADLLAAGVTCGYKFIVHSLSQGFVPFASVILRKGF